MSNHNKLKATGLRSGLVGMLIVIIIGSVAGFYYGYQYLSSFAEDTKTAVESALGSKAVNSQQVEKLREAVESRRSANTKAINFTVPASNYQTQTIQDINRYASRYGVSISNYSFDNGSTVSVGNGISVAVVTVSLQNPIDFTNLMRFVRGIETNTPKLQLQGISVSQNQAGNSNVRVEPLKIEVYTR